MNELLDVLGRQRHVLEYLLFRILEARHLLDSSEVRFLHLAAQDIDAASEAVREVELRRALLPIPDGMTLRQLSDAARPPLADILYEHLLELSRLAAELGAATEAVGDLAAAGLARTRNQEFAMALSGARRSATELDELDREIVVAGYEALLTASAQLTLPSLVAFLG